MVPPDFHTADPFASLRIDKSHDKGRSDDEEDSPPPSECEWSDMMVNTEEHSIPLFVFRWKVDRRSSRVDGRWAGAAVAGRRFCDSSTSVGRRSGRENKDTWHNQTERTNSWSTLERLVPSFIETFDNTVRCRNTSHHAQN